MTTGINRNRKHLREITLTPKIINKFLNKTKITPSCWIWTGYIDKDGYGMLTDRSRYLVHRISYQLYNGKIIDNMVIDHLCKNRKCVNPNHLDMITKQENNLRSSSPSSINIRKKKCKHGHILTNENTYIQKFTYRKPRRLCRKCISITCKKWRIKNHDRIYNNYNWRVFI